jgi:hypothetical protein
MYSALQRGHAETVQVFTECELASKGLSTGSKIKLLRDKTRGFSGLYGGLHKGQTAAVNAFTERVSSTHDLDALAKVDLLAAKANDGVPALLAALTTPHAETVRGYVQMVATSA